MMNKLSKGVIFSILALVSVISHAEEKANSLVNSRVEVPVAPPELSDLLEKDNAMAPNITNHDMQIEQLRKQTEILQAQLDRNGLFRQLEDLYGLDHWLQGGATVGGNENPTGSGLETFAGIDGSSRGASDFMAGNTASSKEAIVRYASMQSYLSFGTEKTAVVRWDPITPTVKSGDILPGGFNIVEIRKNDIVMEKDGIVFSLTQEPVSIDDLMAVIAQKREGK
ncbi:hypothetical protein [Reinekea sp. G2M2-21]|uniref:hypothetical protein n=1 Tax=Reinekea sp. G2M2-21 TaxID=2788942 RepID=UPI0018AAE5EA|nr:hypothetical protein [Reinekea sp. G2M2-21]